MPSWGCALQRGVRPLVAQSWLVLLVPASLLAPVAALEVDVSLESAWPAAPLAAEMLEGLAAVGRGSSFLRALSEKANTAEASAWRQITSQAAEAQLSGGGDSAFAKFLSLRARHALAATRVEASRGLERADREAQAVAPSLCPLGAPWALVAGNWTPTQAICEPSQLAFLGEQLQQLRAASQQASASASGKRSPPLLRSSLDYVLYEADSEGEANLQLIAYVDLGTPGSVAGLLPSIFKLVDEFQAQNLPAWIVVRHGLAGTERGRRGALVGYGVELLARSADEVAKSADDEGGAGGVLSTSATQSNASTGEGLCGAEPGSAASDSDPAGQFHGLDLAALARRHPKSSSAICKLRTDLRAAVESPPAPWELKRLGAKVVLRSKEVAEGPGGGAAGLAALAEVTQDFPSGWARALAAGDAKEAETRELMTVADDIQAGLLEINSWRVPTARRGILPILHVHAPIFCATELLAQAGFDPNPVVAILRDMRPGQPVPDRIMTGDPRLPALGTSPPTLFDVTTDPDAASIRAQDNEQEERSRGYYPPGAGSLIRLVQFYGRFWSFPPPVPRRLLGLGLTLDLCSKKQLQLVDLLTRQALPAVIWVRLQASQSGEAQKAAAFLNAGLTALVDGSGGAPAARQFMKTFASTGSTKGDELCGSGVFQRAEDSWKKFSKMAKTAKSDDLGAAETEEAGGIPFPSATVNGRLIFGVALLDGSLETLLREELEALVRKLSMQEDVEFTDSDEAIARWQLQSSKISVWHPALLPDSSTAPRFLPLPAETLEKLPGGLGTAAPQGSSSALMAVHLLLLGDPLSPPLEPASEVSVSTLAEEGPLSAPALFLAAYGQHLASKGRESDGGGSFARFLYTTVAGGCPAAAGPATKLTIAAALRRCISAALPGASAQEELVDMASPLAGLAKAFRGASEAVKQALQKGDAAGSAVASLLSSCKSVSDSAGGWHAAADIKQGELVFTELDLKLCAAQQKIVQQTGAPPAGAATLLVNGKLHGPLFPVQSGVRFQSVHCDLAEQLELAYGSKLSGVSAQAFPAEGNWPSSSLISALKAASLGKEPLSVSYALAVCARAMQELQALRSGTMEGEMQDGSGAVAQIEEDEQGFAPAQRAFTEAPQGLRLHLPAREGVPSPLQIFVTFDPLGQDAQRLPAQLLLLHEELNAEVGIILRPKALVAPPLLSYYREALPAKAPAGGLAALGTWDGVVPQVHFSLPARRGLLLSMQLSTPQAWLCSAVDSSGADLDSLRPDLGGNVQARYVLEALFVEGFADQGHGGGRRGRAAAGRQLALSALGATATSAEGIAGRDSVVVKSGYFQLRAPPGLYQLTLQGGPEQEQLLWPRGAVELADLAGRSTLLHARVGAAAGADASAAGNKKDEGTTPSPSLDSAAYDGAGGDSGSCKETIHIFSVASGHKYERLLRIMMLSVREHTKCPLRFWLVDNFLSPNFRRILPALAKKVGFAVSSVTYKWPTWLRAQTQKQRVIWAYKILFLDVFFPRQVERVLFIDADQIVRADVKELWDFDLKEAVYGFVPFCGSGPKTSSLFSSWSKEEDVRNPDTVGFRFWEQGFWQKHLGQDRFYHISALFVVNLKLFRKSGAGDILRDVYQSLTEDPHSLANLDQDLPNYVQRELPIFSLPPEWLWCESWCSNATKARAKTIDMCQHPSKKEGKLQQARRIAPEWVEYDARLEAWVHQITQAAED